MSDEPGGAFYYHDLFNSNNPSFTINPSSSPSDHDHPLQAFPDFFQGSSDYNTSFTRAFGLSPPSPQPLSLIKDDKQVAAVVEAGDQSGGGGGGDQTPVSPTSFILSSSSNEAVGDEDNSHRSKIDAEESSKTPIKQKKKAERKQREPRVAFMTKSEVDHLEDGYRWRKYGQKAVKNSPFPRSYYRCTTQKCTVKKRVERSFQDPTTVVTTYEGQHNHPLPSTLRGNVAAMLSPSMLTAAPPPMMMGRGWFPHQQNDLMAQVNQGYTNFGGIMSSFFPQSGAGGGGGGGGVTTTTTTTMQQQQQQQHHQQQNLHLPDYGLLQDMVPRSISFKQEP